MAYIASGIRILTMAFDLSLPPLEVACHVCDGSGGWSKLGGGEIVCHGCNGQAYFPTDAGDALLDFIERGLERRRVERDREARTSAESARAESP